MCLTTLCISGFRAFEFCWKGRGQSSTTRQMVPSYSMNQRWPVALAHRTMSAMVSLFTTNNARRRDVPFTVHFLFDFTHRM